MKCLKLFGLTDFEYGVLRETLKVPCGKVSSYGRIAEAIGKPKAARAVGRALNKNPLPGVVPCHRVIRSDGSIGGFFKGVNEKRRLLESEGVVS